MPFLLDLPAEILTQILGYVGNTRPLKSLRLTCRTLKCFATRELFNIIRFHPSRDSYHKLRRITKRKLIRNVRKIVVDSCIECEEWGVLEKREERPLAANPPSEQELFEQRAQRHQNKEHPVPRDFNDLVRRLKRIRNLESAEFWFCEHDCPWENFGWDIFDPKTKNLGGLVFQNLVASLESSGRSLKELILHDMPGSNPTDAYTVAILRRALSGLRELRMNVDNGDPALPGTLIQDSPYPATGHSFFNALPAFWFKPCMETLQHLTFCSAKPFGVTPKVDWRGIHFPRLQTLRLDGYQFCHDSQLDWILSHSATLETLFLDSPAIVVQAVIQTVNLEHFYMEKSHMTQGSGAHSNKWVYRYSKRWHHYFLAFQNGLPHLRKFRIRYEATLKDDDDWMDDQNLPNFTGEGYRDIDDTRLSQYHYVNREQPFKVKWPRCIEKDMQALRELKEWATKTTIHDRDWINPHDYGCYTDDESDEEPENV